MQAEVFPRFHLCRKREPRFHFIRREPALVLSRGIDPRIRSLSRTRRVYLSNTYAHVITSALVSRTRGIIQHFAHPQTNAWANGGNWTSRGCLPRVRFIPERETRAPLARGPMRGRRTFNQFSDSRAVIPRAFRRFAARQNIEAGIGGIIQAPRNLQSDDDLRNLSVSM